MALNRGAARRAEVRRRAPQPWWADAGLRKPWGTPQENTTGAEIAITNKRVRRAPRLRPQERRAMPRGGMGLPSPGRGDVRRSGRGSQHFRPWSAPRPAAAGVETPGALWWGRAVEAGRGIDVTACPVSCGTHVRGRRPEPVQRCGI